MPVCICGQRVERKKEAVQCIRCKGMFHALCCNIKICDIDLMNAYKCDSCRKAIRTSPVPLPIANEVSYAADKSATTVVCLNESTNNTKVDFDPVVIHDSLNELSHAVKESSVKICDQSPKPGFVSMEALFKELQAVKLSNEKLVDIVKSLKEDNKKLLSVVNELQYEVRSAVKSVKPAMITDVSPKRKKSKPTNGQHEKISKAFSKNSDDRCEKNIAPTVKTNDMTSSPPSCSGKNLSYASITRAPQLVASSNLSDVADTREDGISIAPAIMNNNTKSEAWVSVSKNKKKRSVTGLNESDELDVYAKYKWIHVSSFKNSVSTEKVINYISNYCKISPINFLCFKLVKKDVNVDNLKFVNLKLGVTSAYYNRMFDSSLWPANIKVRPFTFLDKEKDVNSKVQGNIANA